MGRPRAVREARKRSDELIEQIKQKQQENEQDNQAGIDQYLGELDESQTDDPGQAQTAPEPDGDQVQDEGAGQANTPPEPEPEPDNEPQDPPASDDLQRRYDELKAEHERLLHSNTVLRGKYESEVPRLAAELRELKQQLEQREQTAEPAGNTPDTGAANTETVEKIKEQLLQEFPEEIVDGMGRMIRAVVAENAPNTQASDKVVGELKNTVTQMAHQLRTQRLTNLVPDWQEIEANKATNGWVQFLQHRDPVSGRERNEFLREAWEGHDVERAAEIFNLFKQQRDSASEKDKPAKPPAEPEPRGAEPQRQPPNKRIWKLSEINQVEREARKGQAGNFRGKENELQRLRAEFRKAAAEGRIDHNR